MYQHLSHKKEGRKEERKEYERKEGGRKEEGPLKCGECCKVNFSTRPFALPSSGFSPIGVGLPKSCHASVPEQVHVLPSGAWSPATHCSTPTSCCFNTGPPSPGPSPGCGSWSQVSFHEAVSCPPTNHRAWDLARNDLFFSFLALPSQGLLYNPWMWKEC